MITFFVNVIVFKLFELAKMLEYSKTTYLLCLSVMLLEETCDPILADLFLYLLEADFRG